MIPTKTDTIMVSSYVPEIDGILQLNEFNMTLNQDVIGILCWEIKIGRVDILFDVFILSQYQTSPP